jgi:predicted nuclease of predicted toxin-antitoxin system
MALRLFADHCVSKQIIAALQEAGHEIIRDFLPTESADGLVAAQAQQLDAILLSLNGDFADIVTYPPSSKVSSPFRS